MDSPSIYRALKHQRASVSSLDDTRSVNTKGQRGQKRTCASLPDSPPLKRANNNSNSNNNNNKEVFIGNLPLSLRGNEALRCFLEQKSRILGLWPSTEADPAIVNVRTMKDPFAFVEVATEDFATLFLSMHRRIDFNGRRLTIQRSKTSPPTGYNNATSDGRGKGRRRFTDSSTTTKERYWTGNSDEVQSHEKRRSSVDLSDLDRQLYVKNIPESMRKDSGRFKEFLTKQIASFGLLDEGDEARYGELVHNIDVLKGDENGEGSAFVEFASESITTSCFRCLNGINCDGQPIELTRPRKWKNMSRLFVGSLPRGVTEDSLREFFLNTMKSTGMLGPNSRENPIADIRVLVRGRGDRDTRHAFITFETEEQAGVAMQLNGIPYMGCDLSVERPFWWKPTADEEDNPNDWSVALKHLKKQRRLENYSCILDDEALCTLLLTHLPGPGTYAEKQLLNFLSSAMKIVALSLYDGDPITNFERYGLDGGAIKFRCATEATRALMLNQIPFNGCFLNFERSPDYPGDYRDNPTRTWPEVLKEFYERNVHLGPSRTAYEDGSTVTAPVSPDYPVGGIISITEHQQKIDELQHVINSKERELTHATEEMLKLEANRHELSGDINTFEVENNRTSNGLGEAHELIRVGKEKIRKLESDVTNLRSSLETSEKTKSELTNKLHKANEDCEALRVGRSDSTEDMQLEQQIRELKSINDDVNRKLEISEQAQAELSKKLETSEQTRTIQSDKLESVQADYKSLKTRFDEMKETKDSLQALLNSNPSSSTAAQQCDNGETAKKLRDLEAKYHKVVDQIMADTMGEMLRQQSSYRELQNDRDELRKDRDKHKNLSEQAESPVLPIERRGEVCPSHPPTDRQTEEGGPQTK